jgi:hypothetical protein
MTVLFIRFSKMLNSFLVPLLTMTVLFIRFSKMLNSFLVPLLTMTVLFILLLSPPRKSVTRLIFMVSHRPSAAITPALSGFRARVGQLGA